MSRILNTRDLNRAKVVGDSTKKVSRSVHISSLLFPFFSRTLSTDSYFKRPFSRYELLVSRSWLDSSSLCSLVPLFLSFFFLNRVINFTADVASRRLFVSLPYDRSIGALIVYSYESIELDIHACKWCV